MITVKDASFSYSPGSFSIHVPEITIPQGSKTAIVGPSGCGKTTLLYLIAGILSPQKGTIRCDNQVFSSLPDKEKRNFRIANIGFVFQEFELLEYLTCYENILLPLYVSDQTNVPAKSGDRVVSVAESVGVAALLDKYPERISQGERQRVALCRALINNPSLILADEPTGNLDPNTALHIMELLEDQVTHRRCTFCMVTHDHSLLDRFDRVVDFTSLLKGERA
ncbi:MAG: ATP-binding cassette domain-containing protein [Chitinivibrionales bacterium]|nr:ATP-binding cassette domain-containing protein [Chitinivibrionales bacterium]